MSYRGLLAIAVGAAFLAFALYPAVFGEAPPVLIRGVLLLAGGGLVALGALSVAWVRRRSRAVQTRAPEAGVAVLHVDDGSGSTSYSLTVYLDEERWLVAAAGGQALAGLAAGASYPCRVWRSGNPPGPVAVEIGGVQVNTLPLSRREPQARTTGR